MTLADAFAKEDRTQVKFSTFYELVKQAAQLETVMNGVNCNVPHKYIREMQTGKKEKEPDARDFMVPGVMCIGIDLGSGEAGEPRPEEEPEKEQEKEEAQDQEGQQEE